MGSKGNKDIKDEQDYESGGPTDKKREAEGVICIYLSFHEAWRE